MSEPNTDDSLLSDLCTICHIHPPKYRCPRCSTRTCSLPCSRRHKLWSQCSGVRDPAAYLRRSELATDSAFDRDFNFITSIERGLERAERDAENRGIAVNAGVSADPAVTGLESEVVGDEAGRKRKRPAEGGLVKGETGFLRGAQNAGVQVIRAPRGMSRNKANASRWHPKHKCLSWTVDWVSPDGDKLTRNCLESCVLADAYDRVYPQPKDRADESDQKTKQEDNQVSKDDAKKKEEEGQKAPEVLSTGDQPAPSEVPTPSEPAQDQAETTSHRGIYLYLHRPRTATKQPVLIPLAPRSALASALRDRVVVEFPTIYALRASPEMILAEKENPAFILEEEYLRTQGPEPDLSDIIPQDPAVDQGQSEAIDLGQIDEKKVLEVLKQDLFEPVTACSVAH
ncbi:zinc finger HIT domain-containing protein [Aspergillus clavatus NRRL 1]|uniref:Box C/D snoRNA protein 1 n=1 Tax=Aspergillus clavatus (strain ATCC 1007 / CBS 513.65 / DSM 816 / NCTC 3887 / NRRL 1 / QM 1276 / 107) TaxID=344612 RepID=A1CBY5_ASPCL|nr:HIT finger domain protein, putative [Aspergillus clavatus NRRL 1]EAW13253.1 HIT finger domain protein, putative [Aspergillus clavatus NRRL 1]